MANTKKIQTTVSESFHEWADRELPDAFRESMPEDLRKNAPRSLTALLPSALVRFAESMGLTVPVEVVAEAAEAMRRKPGPKAKTQIDFVDGKPGVWLSSVRVTAGNAIAECGGIMLNLAGCWTLQSAAQAAYLAEWGAIPECKDGLPGLRFIPPGASLTPEVPKHKPIAVAQIGVFVSEADIQREALAIVDGRIVPDHDKLNRHAIRFAHAKLPASITEKLNTDERQREQLANATIESFRGATADAVDMGWTVVPEVRKRKKGRRFVPPGVKLKYELPDGNKVEVG